MGRKHRRGAPAEYGDIERMSHGGATTESRRGQDWYVRSVPVSRAEKIYKCPGCERDIAVSQAHIVAWSADNIFGDSAGLRDRRHWHTHCWRLA